MIELETASVASNTEELENNSSSAEYQNKILQVQELNDTVIRLETEKATLEK